jgi:hypothetical protein
VTGPDGRLRETPALTGDVARADASSVVTYWHAPPAAVADAVEVTPADDAVDELVEGDELLELALGDEDPPQPATTATTAAKSPRAFLRHLMSVPRVDSHAVYIVDGGPFRRYRHHLRVWIVRHGC